MAADQPLCAICHQPLADGTSVEALPCIHSFHEYCLTEYALAKNVQKSALRCPVCRHAGDANTPPQIEEVEEDAQPRAEPAVAVAAEPEVAEPPVAEPAVASAEPEVAEPVVANTGKRGGKAKAKGRGKAKAKAKAKANAESEVHSPVVVSLLGKGKGKAAKAKAKPRAKAQQEATAAEATAAEATSPEADAMVEDTVMEADECTDFLLVTQCHLCGKDGVVKEQKNCISSLRDEWKCTQCNSTRVTLYKYKCYPTHAWQTDTERHAFWQQSQSLDKEGKLALARQYSQSNVSTESETFMEGGSFWPLTYWAAKGLDTERIAKFSPAECIREDEVLGTCYKVIIVSESNKRKFDKVMQDTTTWTPEGQASSTAASSSGGGDCSGLTFTEMIARKKAQDKEEKEASKLRKSMLAKAARPAESIIKTMSTIKENLKVDKLPLAMQVENPLEYSIMNVQKAIDALNDTYSDAHVKQLTEEIEKSKHVAKSMRMFT